MAADKIIPLKDVQSALKCAVIRLKSRTADGQRHGRTAAMTQAPFWEPTCKDRRRRGLTPARAMRQHFTPMHTGDMDKVLERTRWAHGLPEIRRTWGAGYRALQAEFSASSVMR